MVAARWTDLPNEQSWMLGVTGLDRTAIADAPARPDLFDPLITRRGAGMPPRPASNRHDHLLSRTASRARAWLAAASSPSES